MTKQPQHPENQPKADERNIVPLDSTYEGASFEDRLFLFWHDYQKIIIGACVVALLALAGWGLIRFLQERKEDRIQAEFQEAVAMDEIKAFAERNSPHPLAGVAYLEAADYHFGNEEYEEAARFYGLAAEDLTEAVVGRARIGHGVALALSGKQEEALAALEEIARGFENFAVIRAEAYYHAATLAVEMGQMETAHQYLDQVAEVDNSQMWSSRARQLKQGLPEPAAEEVTAPEEEPVAEASDAN